MSPWSVSVAVTGLPTFAPAEAFSTTLLVVLVPLNVGALLSTTLIVTVMLALAVPSLATTSTVYVLWSSVTPASVRSWPLAELMSNDAASAPSRVWFSVVPASASVAVTGSPMDVPAGALLDTLRVEVAPSVNTGGLFGGAVVASIATVILAKSVPSSAATVTP